MKKVILNSIFAICIVVSFTSCDDLFGGGKKKPDCIPGTWINDNSEILTFESNKKGQLNCIDTIYDFTYKIESSKIIFKYNKKTAKDNNEENIIDRSDTLSYSCNCPVLKIDNKEWDRIDACNDNNSSNGGGGGNGSGDRKISPIITVYEEPIMTPPGKGGFIVYFGILCLYENEKVSIYIDGSKAGDITTPITGNTPPDCGDERGVGYLLDVGRTYTLTAKIGKEDLGGTSLQVKQNYCYKLRLELPCPK